MFLYLLLGFAVAFLLLLVGMALWLAPNFSSQVASSVFLWVPHDKLDAHDVRDLGGQIVSGGAIGAYVAFLALFVQWQAARLEQQAEARNRELQEALQLAQKRATTYSEFFRAAKQYEMYKRTGSHQEQIELAIGQLYEALAELELIASPSVLEAGRELVESIILHYGVPAASQEEQSQSPKRVQAARSKFVETFRRELAISRS